MNTGGFSGRDANHWYYVDSFIRHGGGLMAVVGQLYDLVLNNCIDSLGPGNQLGQD